MGFLRKMVEKKWNEELKEWIIRRLNCQELIRGARVKIRMDSEYAGQNKGSGTMKDDFSKDLGEYVGVTFDDGYSNSYRRRDLELANPIPESELRARKLDKGEIISASRILGVSEENVWNYIGGKVQEVESIPKELRAIMYTATGIRALKPKFELPDFNGNELEINGKEYKAGFLSGPFGREVFNEFRDIASIKYIKNKSLAHAHFDEGLVKALGIFEVVLINSIIRPAGYRTATPADLERILEQKTLDLSDCSVDTGLVLRSQCENNTVLAQDLAKQIKKRDGKFEYPVMIPLVGLDLDDQPSDVSRKSGYGLAFKLREDARVIYAPQLIDESRRKTFNRGDENGLPILGEGDRLLVTGKFGLVNMTLDLPYYHTNNHLLDNNLKKSKIVVVGPGGNNK